MMTSQSGAGWISTPTPEYVTLRKCYKVLVQHVQEQAGEFCDTLFSEQLVTPYVCEFVRSQTTLNSDKARKLVDSVLGRIQENPSIYHSFVKIVENEGPWMKDVVKRLQECYEAECKQATQPPQSKEDDRHSSGGESFHSATDNLDEPGFECPHCGECTLDKFFSEEGCPKKKISPNKKALFPFLDVSALDEEDKIDLEARLISDTTKMIKRFAIFTQKIKQSLQDVPLKEVIDSVLSLEAFTEDIGVKLLDSEDKELIRAASCLSDVFITLRDYMSFFNYQIIEHLIDCHGSCDDRKRLEEYISAFNTFCQRSVFEIPLKSFCTKSRRSGKVFALKCTGQRVTTLENTQGVKIRVAEVFGLRSSALQLCSIAKGCVEVRFFVSEAVAKCILPVSQTHQLALSAIGVRVVSSNELSGAEGEQEGQVEQQEVQSFLHQSKTSLPQDTQLPTSHPSSTLPLHGSPPIISALRYELREPALNVSIQPEDYNIHRVVSSDELASAEGEQEGKVEQQEVQSFLQTSLPQDTQLPTSHPSSTLPLHGSPPIISALRYELRESALNVPMQPEDYELGSAEGEQESRVEQQEVQSILHQSKSSPPQDTQLPTSHPSSSALPSHGSPPIIPHASVRYGLVREPELDIQSPIQPEDYNVHLAPPPLSQEYRLRSQQLVETCMRGSVSGASSLMKKGADMDFLWLGRSPLTAACEGGHTKTAKFLINKGANLLKHDNTGRSPLIAACEGGHTKTAQFLIDIGAHVNECDERERSPLLAACERGHTKTAQFLIKKRADLHKLDSTGRSPLLVACDGGHTKTAQFLIDVKADMNQCDERERSPLLAACEGGHTKTAQFLIKKGADLRKLDVRERSPLLAACERGHTETVQFLIDRGADMNQCDKRERSPLLAACERGHFTTAHFLIDEGADTNKVDDRERSPLLAACEGGHTNTAQFLIEKGADVLKLDNRERSPLLTACERGYTDIVQLLIDKEADMNKCDNRERSPLLAACEGGHTKTAQFLIDKGADMNNCDSTRRSPLLAAYEGGHIETAQMLIDKGADVTKCDSRERSPFLVACEGGHTKTAQLLLDKGADRNKCDDMGRSPLLATCEEGHTDTAHFLIAKGADMNKCDNMGWSPLVTACVRGHTETAHFLIDKGADVDKCDNLGRSPLLTVCERGYTDTAQLLIDKGADWNKCDNKERSPLLAACEKGHIKIAQFLIDKGADMNECDSTRRSLLLAACEGGHIETVQFLIDKGADINKCDIRKRSPFLVACEGGHTNIAQFLIDKGADWNKCDDVERSPLQAACEEGHTETAHFLIGQGADINSCDIMEWSPLLAACVRGHTETARFLIDKGADMDKHDNLGRSPLLVACYNGDIETAQLLIDKGADMKRYDNTGRSPLLAACEKGHTKTAQLLIEKGADVNKCDNLGRSPLLVACSEGDTATAQLLMNKGADKNKCDIAGKSPLYTAHVEGHRDIVKLLLVKKGAVDVRVPQRTRIQSQSLKLDEMSLR